MNSSPDGLNAEALLAHFAEEEKLYGAVTPPIFQNSLFVYEKSEDLLAALSSTHQGPPYVYSKVSNPTNHILERKVAALEGMEACKAIGGGMGAIAVALGTELKGGAHAIIVESAYGPARSFLKHLEDYGVTHTLVEGGDTTEILDNIRPETAAIYLESPSSILFRMQDVPAITKIAREKKITTFFDNTYCTPIHMRPGEFGIDVVIHSASKYLGGHSDLNAGVVCSDEVRINRIVSDQISYYSNLMHPFSAWLLLRGLRTLKLRVAQHQIAANHVASWLETHPKVKDVRHISLESFPQRELYLKLMKGSGGIFSFEPVDQERSSIMAFCDALENFGRGISWGGFESLVVPVQTKVESGETKWLIRLFCGLEDPEDLRKDVEKALVHLSNG